MRTSEWYVSLGMVILSYFVFVFFVDFRFITIIFFSFIFSAIDAREEKRVGRTILRTITPLLISVALLFSAAIVGSSISGGSPLQSGQASIAAFGFIILLLLCLFVGVPLAWAGAQTRRFYSPLPE